MRTVIIQDVSQEISYYLNLMRKLYDLTLKDDPQFHFFLELPLIIRVSDKHCLKMVRMYLSDNEIAYCEDEYPQARHSPYGEGQFVIDNLNTFLPVFHAHAVAALTLNEAEHQQYLERVIHTAFNPRGLFHDSEGAKLLELGLNRILVGQRIQHELTRSMVERMVK